MIFSSFLILQFYARVCLKNHFRNLQAPLCGIFSPHSDKISHKLGLTAYEKPFSASLQCFYQQISHFGGGNFSASLGHDIYGAVSVF